MATGNHKVEILVTARDLATQSLRNIEKTVGSIGRGFGQVGNFMGNFSRGLDNTINKMDRLANSMYRFNMYTSSINRNLTNIAAVGGLAAGAVAYQGLSNTLDYDYNTRIMQSRMNVSDNVRKQVSDFILNDLNLRVSYTPTEISETGIILGQGGISSAPDMKALLNTTTYFAEAVNAVPAQAAEMIISAAKGFDISMQNSSTITDKLTVALNESLLHVEEMPHAIGELSGRAALYGQSLDSSLTALMTMRNQGMSAAQGAQDLLHGLRQVSYIGNEMVLFPRRRSYYEALGIDDSFFNKETRQLEEYPKIIESLERTMLNNNFVNPRYREEVKTWEDFEKLRDSGQLPSDFWDNQKAAPLIGRVFGAAGMAPMMMGLQTKYDQVNPNTGEVENTYYGSTALKKMQERIENSTGTVDNTHNIIAESGKFNLEVLQGAWEAAQVRFLDNMVPLISTTSQLLVDWLTPKGDIHDPRGGATPLPLDDTYKSETGLDKFRAGVNETAEKFRASGNVGTGNVIETVGNGIADGIQIGQNMSPVIDQISKAFNENIVKADWGSNIIEFPMHIVKNLSGFITDLITANEEFDRLVKQLPPDLQDPAKLVETLSKAGLVFLATSAIVKVVELAIRGVSTALKAGKIAVDLTAAIAEWIAKQFKNPGDLIEDTIDDVSKNIHANVVNVYGKTINDGGKGGGDTVVTGDGKDGKGGKKSSKKSPPIVTGAKNLLEFAKYAGPVAGVWGIAALGEHMRENPDGKAAKIRDKITPYRPDNYTYTDYMKEMNAKIPKNTEMSEYNPNAKPSYYDNFSTVDMNKVYENVHNIAKSHVQKETNLATKSITTENGRFVNDLKSTTDSGISSLNGSVTEGLNLTKDITDKGVTMLNSSVVDGLNSTKDATERNLSSVTSSVVEGFNVANDKLQNIKVDNNVTVNVAPANISISGNIRDVLSVTHKPTGYTTNSIGGAARSTQKMQQRRLGWR